MELNRVLGLMRIGCMYFQAVQSTYYSHYIKDFNSTQWSFFGTSFRLGSFLLVLVSITTSSRTRSATSGTGPRGSTVVFPHGHTHHDEFPHSPLQSHRGWSHRLARTLPDRRSRSRASPYRQDHRSARTGTGSRTGSRASTGAGSGAAGPGTGRHRCRCRGRQPRRGVMLGVLAPVRPIAPSPLVGPAGAVAVPVGRVREVQLVQVISLHQIICNVPLSNGIKAYFLLFFQSYLPSSCLLTHKKDG